MKTFRGKKEMAWGIFMDCELCLEKFSRISRVLRDGKGKRHEGIK